MTVGDLKQLLYELSEDGTINEDTEIRLAQQPRWAFEYATGYNAAVYKDALYLEGGPQIGYLPEDVAEQLEW